MNILNKLNGWQRIWLLGTAAAQLYLVLTSRWLFWPTWESCLKREAQDLINPYISDVCVEYYPRQGVFIEDISDNLHVLFLCLAFYAAAHLAVIIVRWVISGFKK